MGRMYLKRRVAFSAAHAYFLPGKSEDENRALFGQWTSRHGHGHNYLVEVTVGGAIDPESGMVVNIVDVDKVLKQHVTGPLNNKHLTYEVPYFAFTVATTENIARYVVERFTDFFSDERAALARVIVWETPTLWATIEDPDVLPSDGLSPRLEKNMVALTRALDFAASHRLHAPAFSDEENREVFGKCNNPQGHGHNYGVEVTIVGEPDPVTGMIVDLEAFDNVLEREIMGRFDHKFLNGDVPDFADRNPTSENLTKVIWEHLNGKIPAPARLYRVIVRETDRNYFEFYGENS